MCNSSLLSPSLIWSLFPQSILGVSIYLRMSKLGRNPNLFWNPSVPLTQEVQVGIYGVVFQLFCLWTGMKFEKLNQ
jgi:hypothetical protein